MRTDSPAANRCSQGPGNGFWLQRGEPESHAPRRVQEQMEKLVQSNAFRVVGGNVHTGDNHLAVAQLLELQGPSQRFIRAETDRRTSRQWHTAVGTPRIAAVLYFQIGPSAEVLRTGRECENVAGYRDRCENVARYRLPPPILISRQGEYFRQIEKPRLLRLGDHE